MPFVPSAPLDGEYLWDEISQTWVPLIKNEFGFPLVEESINNAQTEELSDEPKI